MITQVRQGFDYRVESLNPFETEFEKESHKLDELGQYFFCAQSGYMELSNSTTHVTRKISYKPFFTLIHLKLTAKQL